jgi:hypothetical protein
MLILLKIFACVFLGFLFLLTLWSYYVFYTVKIDKDGSDYED